MKNLLAMALIIFLSGCGITFDDTGKDSQFDEVYISKSIRRVIDSELGIACYRINYSSKLLAA